MVVFVQTTRFWNLLVLDPLPFTELPLTHIDERGIYRSEDVKAGLANDRHTPAEKRRTNEV